MNTSKKWLSALLMIVTLLIAGCGGGGSSGVAASPTATVSGVAAAGAPVIGFAYLKDKNGTTLGPAAIDGSGNFSFTYNPNTLVPPFMLKADGSAGGQGFTLYSVATGAGTANINPFTNLAVAAAAGKEPAQVYGAGSTPPDVTKMTSANLQAAIAAIKTMLQPLLTTYGVSTFDPLTGGYVANSSNPLDAMLDVVSVDVTSSGTVNVTNKLDDSMIATGDVKNVAALQPTTSNIPPASVTTEIEEIKARLATWSSTLNKGTALTAADLDPYYIADPDFGVNNGHSRAMEIGEMVASFNGGDISQLGAISAVANFGIMKDLTALYSGKGVDRVYAICADFVFGSAGGNFGSPENMVIARETATGLWKLIGNGDLLDAYISAAAFRWITTAGTPLIKTGLCFEVEDIGNLGINSATITGPGLGIAGITVSKPLYQPTFLELDLQDNTIPTSNNYFKPLVDADINVIPDNAVYTITFQDNSGATKQIMRTIKRRPLNSGELTSGHFPTFSPLGFALTHSFSSTTNLLGQMATFSYTSSSLYKTAWLEAFYYLNAGPGNSVEVTKNLRLNATTDSMVVLQPGPGFVPNFGFIAIEAEDHFRRIYRYVWMIGP